MIYSYPYYNLMVAGANLKASAKINTPEYDETTPYMAADGVTMYFSSDRPGGLGDNDIWMTKRLDKT